MHLSQLTLSTRRVRTHVLSAVECSPYVYYCLGLKFLYKPTCDLLIYVYYYCLGLKILYKPTCDLCMYIAIDKRDGLVDKTFGLSAGRSWVRILGRGKCSLRTTAVDAGVNYRLYFIAIVSNTSYDWLT